ncbi:MAG TPA: YceK/YidQ family lipoprotein [Schlesneria sp.]|jgi:uncharacterized protein YceK
MCSPRFITIFLIASNCGCASVGFRTGAYGDSATIYPATRSDAGNISYVVSRPFRRVDPTTEVDAQEGLAYLFAPVALIDLPLAVTVDTLLLPYDLYKLRNKDPGKDSFREWKDVVADKSSNDPFRELE